MVIGLTGKSCAGKDEVAKILYSFGFVIIDEDKLGHIALKENKQKLVDAFSDIILTDGEVDRKKLSKLVFSNKENLKKLESISHPWMIEETKRIEKEESKKGNIVVINAAILFRLGLDKISDEIVYVDAPLSLRAERAMLRNGTKKEDFLKREENQEDISYIFETFCGKIVKVINDKDKESLYRQVKDYCDTILARG